jgi:homotetrameric cytidine deaminase
MNITSKELIAAAESARLASYAPYSNFAVGAALLCADGTVYKGCNIENSSFTPTCCAERVAVFKAVSESRRDFVAIAIVGGKMGASERDFCYPCGVCRQVLAEFCAPDMPVYVANSKGDILTTSVGELLPYSFKLKVDDNE